MLGGFLAGLTYRLMTSEAELALFHAFKDSRVKSNATLERIPVNFSLWSPQRVAYYRQALAQRFDPPLAVLRISRIGLEAPVLEGTDDSILNRGVGHISGTARPGQKGTVGIAGHRDSFFRVLKSVAIGDAIELEAQDGTYKYRVTHLLVVDPADVNVLRPATTPSLALVTCYPFYFVGSAPKRYIVQASMGPTASSKDQSKSMQEMSNE